MSAPLDTHLSAERVQIDLLRSAGTAKRAAIALAMTTAAVKLSRRAIQRIHPDWSEQEINLLWLEVHYGKDLADRVRADLAARTRA